jgi:Domain of unknown function (DUF4157)/Family of unknown function (DUF5995)
MKALSQMRDRLKIQRKKPNCVQPKSEELTQDFKIPGAQPGHDINRISLRPQAKLTISHPQDQYEQEAEQVALQVMTMTTPLNNQTTLPEVPEEEQEENPLQMKSSPQSGDSNFQNSDDLEGKLNATKGGGNPLPNEVRGFMEPRFGADLSDVRVHTDSAAVQMNRDLDAQAFTYGSDIYFGAGKSPGNNQLTAHELTHVQQQMGVVQRQSQEQNSQNPGQNIPWHETGNLRGNPPVRDKVNPPNKDVIEDEAVYNQRRTAAEASLVRQKERANSLLDKQGNVNDYRYWFAKVYSFVTENELNFAAANAFYYPSYVMASVLYFDQIYEDNFKAFNEGGKVEDHWKKAFEEGVKQKELTDLYYEMMLKNTEPDAAGGLAMAAMMQSVLGAVQSLVASMKAHIRFDLPRAEAWVFNNYYSQFPNAKLNDFRPDFMSMSGVFDNAAREMNKDMANRLGLPVDMMPQLMQDTSMRQLFDADMATERVDTWRRAEELVSSGKAGTDPYKFDNGKLSGNVTESDNLVGLNNLPTEALRPNMENSAVSKSDSEIRADIKSMSDSDIALIPATQKVQMIRRLLKGWTGGEDETTILRMLNASKTSGDLAVLIDGSDAWDMMYAIDGANAKTLREFFRDNYYGKTGQQTALRLIRKCLDGETAEWEEEMVADLLQKRDDRRSIVEEIGNIYGGPATGSDKNFKNGLYKLEWQLDGAEEEAIYSLFGSSDLGWWNF